jgi:hypothetical protein
MKKLIAISVMFALIAGAAFAADIGAAIDASIAFRNFGDTGVYDPSKIDLPNRPARLRLDGSGGDDSFGGYIRFSGDWGGFGSEAYAWWKPIDQLKLKIGNFSDGFWGQDGITGWNFYQKAGDAYIADEGWARGDSFFGGYGSWGLFLELTPTDMFTINIGLPFSYQEAKDAFKQIVAQVAVNLDFGTVAFTYVANGTHGRVGQFVEAFEEYFGFAPEFEKKGSFYAYLGLTAIENLSLDVGIGYHLKVSDLDYTPPLGVGIGATYNISDSFGLKARLFGNIAMESGDALEIIADVQPYFNISDSITVFVSAGLKVTLPDGGDTVIGWHFNPYLRIGNQWSGAFFAGVRLSSDGGEGEKVAWKFPIGLVVSF